MTAPELCYYGRVTGPFPIYVEALRAVREIRDGNVSERRSMCYPEQDLGDRFLKAVRNKLEVGMDELSMEIFIPDRLYPPHTDGGGLSFFVPLDEDCTIDISGVTQPLLSWGIYSFDDGKPHSTSGAMLMMKPSSSFSYPLSVRSIFPHQKDTND
jgi:hypothetical protein